MSADDADQRFARFSSDPKFRTVPRKEKKVEIDERFGALFNKEDKRFAQSEISVDKRGRPKKNSQRDNYGKYYKINEQEDGSDEEDSDSDKDDEEMEEKRQEKKKAKRGLDANIKNKLHNPNVDYARGEGNLFSDDDSSSGDDDSSDDDDDSKKSKNRDKGGEEQFDKWGELDHDAERTEEATRRLALCNMDWDRVGAQDIFIAMSSFCPTGQAGVKSVKVYLSEFGRKRKTEEDLLGPEELRVKPKTEQEEEDAESASSDDDTNAEEIDKKAMERVRRYQVNRLKYYYAVVEFDSVDSANKVYEECDGTEYELSATRFDLRFIPHNMEFEEEPETNCESMPNPDKYQPKHFNTTALSLGKVELTWDETDPQRKLTLRKAFEEGDEGKDDDLMAYVAMSSSEEEEEKNPHEGEENSSGDEEEGDAIEKYKALLADAEHKEKKEKEEKGNMEISWGPSDKTKKERDEKEVEMMAPWEQFLHKKKEKRNAKREVRKEKRRKEEADGDEEDIPDDIPDGVDFDDPFFRQELDDDSRKKQKSKKKKKEKANVGGGGGKDLSLLVMDEEEDDRRHFDYKDIVAEEFKGGKKKKKKRNQQEASATAGEEFKLDLGDNRFQAVFGRPEFNVDPSNPHFKKTKSMQQIVDEKQRRITSSASGEPSKKKSKAEPKASTSSSNLDNLVRAVGQKLNGKTKGAEEAKKGKKKRQKPK